MDVASIDTTDNTPACSSTRSLRVGTGDNLLGVSLPLVCEALDAGVPAPAVLDELYKGHRFLRWCDSEESRVAIISYRAVTSDDDGWTLDEGAFLSAIKSARAVGVEYIWLDAWAYRKRPYVHEDFCRTLTHVMLTVSHVIWLPRSREHAVGQYQYRLWCTFEAIMVALRSELTVSIAGHAPSNAQRRLLRWGAYLMVPPWAALGSLARHDGSEVHRLGLLNATYYGCMATLLFFYLVSGPLEGMAVVKLLPLGLQGVAWSIVYLACRRRLGMTMEVARNGANILRVMHRAARSSLDGVPRPTMSDAQVCSTLKRLQRELPWLPAYDRRDAMTVKAVIDAFSLRRAVAAEAKTAAAAAAARSAALLPTDAGQIADADTPSADAEQQRAATIEAVQVAVAPQPGVVSLLRRASVGLRRASMGLLQFARKERRKHHNHDATLLSIFTAASLQAVDAVAGDKKPNVDGSPQAWLAQVGIHLGVSTPRSTLVKRETRTRGFAQAAAANRRDCEQPLAGSLSDGVIKAVGRLSDKMDVSSLWFTHDDELAGVASEYATELRRSDCTSGSTLKPRRSDCPSGSTLHVMKDDTLLSYSDLGRHGWSLIRGVDHSVKVPHGVFYVSPPRKITCTLPCGKTFHWGWDLRSRGGTPPSSESRIVVWGLIFFTSETLTQLVKGATIAFKLQFPMSDSAWTAHRVVRAWIVGLNLSACLLLLIVTVQVADAVHMVRIGRFPLPIRRSGKLEYGLLIFATALQDILSNDHFPMRGGEGDVAGHVLVFTALVAATIELILAAAAACVSAARCKDPRLLLELTSNYVERHTSFVL